MAGGLALGFNTLYLKRGRYKESKKKNFNPERQSIHGSMKF